jgi:hypothetical protein
MFQNGADGSSLDSITPFGTKDQVTGGTWPAKLWADYMKPVLAMPAWTATTQFPPPAYVGGAPTPSATPTVSASATATPTSTPSATPTQVAVPQIAAGTLESAAQAQLLAVGLQPMTVTQRSATVPAGDVISVDPAPGTLVAPGSTVTLNVSSGPPATPTPSAPAVATPIPTPSP